MMIRCLSGEGTIGGATVTAISGIELALWDLIGRALNTPISTLFGGRLRESVRIYADCHAGESHDPASYAERAREVVGAGFTAIKFDLDNPNPFTQDISNDPHPRRPWYEPFNRTIGAAELRWMVSVAEAIRGAVGDDIMLALDSHWKYAVPDAVRLAGALEPHNLLWLEDPVPPRTSTPRRRSPTRRRRRSARVRISIASMAIVS